MTEESLYCLQTRGSKLIVDYGLIMYDSYALSFFLWELTHAGQCEDSPSILRLDENARRPKADRAY